MTVSAGQEYYVMSEELGGFTVGPISVEIPIFGVDFEATYSAARARLEALFQAEFRLKLKAFQTRRAELSS